MKEVISFYAVSSTYAGFVFNRAGNHSIYATRLLERGLRRVIANKFNSYFVSLASNLNTGMLGEINLTEIPSFESYLPKSCNSSIFFEDCDPIEIIDVVKEFANNKASDIPIVVIKRTIEIIAPKLSQLYNTCFSSGIFPSNLKIGKITQI